MSKKLFAIFALLSVLMITAFSSVGCSMFRDPSEDVKPHLIAESEKETDPVRRSEQSEETLGFYTSTAQAQYDELIRILYDGYRPDFTKALPVVKQVYDAAIAVLDRYILNDFSDYERVHAIHDWLAYYTEYDFDLYNLGDAANSTHSSFGPDGVLLKNKAVCDGFAKAFGIMCGIEQIKTIRVTGSYVDDSGREIGHSWNKVLLYGKWYNIDATLDSFHVESDSGRIDILNHGYYLLSDNDISDPMTGRHKQIGTVPADVDYDATDSYDFHAVTSLGLRALKMEIGNQSDLNSVFEAVAAKGGKVGKIELRLNFPEYDESNLSRFDAYVAQISEAYSKVKDCDYKLDPANRIYPYRRYPRGVFVFLIYK